MNFNVKTVPTEWVRATQELCKGLTVIEVLHGNGKESAYELVKYLVDLRANKVLRRVAE